VSLVSKSRPNGPGLLAPCPTVPAEAEYHFLLGRSIDAATLERATALAARWGVHPHDVLIANGWLDADDYYRALADSCGASFKAALAPGEAVPPAGATPRQCLARGLLRERTGARAFVLAPDRVRPNSLRHGLAQFPAQRFVLTSPQALHEAVYRHFAPVFAQGAVEALARRRPEQSARTRTPRWQRLVLALAIVCLVAALALAPLETVRVITLALAVLFVPVIGLRIVAAYGLSRAKADETARAGPHVPDAELPTYTILAPLYREAHMLAPLVQALTRLDWPVFRRCYTKGQPKAAAISLSFDRTSLAPRPRYRRSLRP
jgi:glycosyltransferase XagB